jgi:hypothetical protein
VGSSAQSAVIALLTTEHFICRLLADRNDPLSRGGWNSTAAKTPQSSINRIHDRVKCSRQNKVGQRLTFALSQADSAAFTKRKAVQATLTAKRSTSRQQLRVSHSGSWRTRNGRTDAKSYGKLNGQQLGSVN